MKYNCPLCQVELTEALGNSLHPGDKDHGYALFCSNPACPAQEVMGHGSSFKDAYSVIQARFVTRTERTV